MLIQVIRIAERELDKEYYVGDGFTAQQTLRGYANFTTEIQADCSELKAIRQQFPGLVIPTSVSPRFFGDTAKLIAGNLKL